MSMTGTIDGVEVITSVQRRRRWSAEEKTTIVQETYAPEMSVSLAPVLDVRRQADGPTCQADATARLIYPGAGVFGPPRRMASLRWWCIGW